MKVFCDWKKMEDHRLHTTAVTRCVICWPIPTAGDRTLPIIGSDQVNHLREINNWRAGTVASTGRPRTQQRERQLLQQWVIEESANTTLMAPSNLPSAHSVSPSQRRRTKENKALISNSIPTPKTASKLQVHARSTRTWTTRSSSSSNFCWQRENRNKLQEGRLLLLRSIWDHSRIDS